MTWNPDLLLEDFRHVADMAGVSLAPDAIAIERRSAPHVPPKSLPLGKMAVYVFSFGQHVLKVGKVGPNSAARYTAQHYNAGSAKRHSGSLVDKTRQAHRRRRPRRDERPQLDQGTHR